MHPEPGVAEINSLGGSLGTLVFRDPRCLEDDTPQRFDTSRSFKYCALVPSRPSGPWCSIASVPRCLTPSVPQGLIVLALDICDTPQLPTAVSSVFYSTLDPSTLEPQCFDTNGAPGPRHLGASMPSSFDALAFVGSSVSKSEAALASKEGAEATGLPLFPPLDTIAALMRALLVGGLFKDPVSHNGQCRITEAHLKKDYAAEVQATRLANMGGLLTAYLDRILHSVTLPELLASELHTVSFTLLQISGFQGHALGRSLAGLVMAHQSVAVSGEGPGDKSTLLDAPISPGHTFGPAVEEILQRSHREREASKQVAAMLLSHAGEGGGDGVRQSLR
ncbi:UNVERIFIED_CONTAM: hypothetical protein FKN15_068485 [Acipenser sinensis]